jgi:undecaprenyl-diphosphatase
MAAFGLKRTRAKLLTLVAFAGAYTLTEAAKAIVQRPRPVPFFSVLPETWSFPSGHSLESAAVYWTIAALLVSQAPTHARRAIVSSLALLPFIVGISRIYLGVHYPTDVFAGWAAGGCWSAGVVGAFHTEIVARHSM